LNNQIGCPCFSSEERHVQLAPHKSIREVGRILAGDGDLDIGEFVPKEADRVREPSISFPVRKPRANDGLAA
jgi:hypothetical protein